MVFMGGSWAYVQRYTGVATQKMRKKWVCCSAVYTCWRVVWMPPPMICRVMNTGLDKAGRRCLPNGEPSCRARWPHGPDLGCHGVCYCKLVNTVLNIATGVFTNDVYKVFPVILVIPRRCESPALPLCYSVVFCDGSAVGCGYGRHCRSALSLAAILAQRYFYRRFGLCSPSTKALA